MKSIILTRPSSTAGGIGSLVRADSDGDEKHGRAAGASSGMRLYRSQEDEKAEEEERKRREAAAKLVRPLPLMSSCGISLVKDLTALLLHRRLRPGLCRRRPLHGPPAPQPRAMQGSSRGSGSWQAHLLLLPPPARHRRSPKGRCHPLLLPG